MAHNIDLAEFLFKRLYEAGARAVHGVPGDYNIAALDYIELAGLDWVGNCNELNTGYAADGHGRIKGIGALTTTFGVGELSAINAIAGAFAERSPWSISWERRHVACSNVEQSYYGLLIGLRCGWGLRIRGRC